MINSWEEFLNATDEFIKMCEDRSYLFEPKAAVKKKQMNELKNAIREHRKATERRLREKQLNLFESNEEK